MIGLLNSARSVIRRLHLQRLVSPLVSWFEERRIAKLGSYEVKALSSSDLEISGFGKKAVLNGLTFNMHELAQSPHEKPTMTVVMSRLSPGDVAWDVGANVGLYSRLMAEVVGTHGRVFAFEPSPGTFEQLKQGLAAHVTPLQMALSDLDGTAMFATPADHSSASRIVSESTAVESDLARVPTVRGDSLLSKEGMKQPAFLKIDVEGHEWSVIQGMKSVISSPNCRCVLIEVHFSLLEQNGQKNAPMHIAETLSACGLTRQQWIGRSHLLAER
jgi:FkbM family methyltransferase